MAPRGTMAERHPRAAQAAAMAVFGTIGVFRRAIPLPSGVVACVRGVVGAAVLAAASAAGGSPCSPRAVRARLPLLALSGAVMALNWIFLFEAYRYTTVATATLCYYMAPTLLILASPVLFGERITPRRGLCAAAAVAGMVPVSGVLDAGAGGPAPLTGIAFGLAAAALYACVIVLNKKMGDIPATDRTVVQLVAAAVACVPYILVAEGPATAAAALTPGAVAALLVVGALHTGLAYGLYFGSMTHLPAQTVALFGYIDPVVAVVLSATVLGEGMGPAELAGAVLILGSAAAGELGER